MKNDIHDLGLVLDSRVRLIVIESRDELAQLQAALEKDLALVRERLDSQIGRAHV